MPPYQQPWADVPFWVLVGLFAVGEYAARVRSFRNRGGQRAERWTLLVVIVAVAAGFIAGFRLAAWRAAEAVDVRWPLFVAGLVFMAAGIVLRQWAIRVLGRFFTVEVRLHTGQVVVERGPYRWIRHPSYTGLIVFFVGLGLALTNWASLAALAVLPTAGLVVRIHAEEAALFAQLGEPYHRFASRRRRLFPGVW